MADAGTVFDWTIKFSDVAIVTATLLGPVLAVQAQKFLERRREIRQRRVWIFQTLMRTRTAMLSPDHVNAINAVPIEFYGARGALKNINIAWKLYLDHLGQSTMPQEVWGPRRLDLFMGLLGKMSLFLGYEFDPVQLRKEIYAPEGHTRLETEQEIMRRGLLKLLSGEGALPMEIRSWPVDKEALAKQVAAHDAVVTIARMAAASQPPQSSAPAAK